MINATTHEFETNLAQLVNNVALPACVIRLALERVLAQVSSIEQECIVKERASQNAAESETEDETE